MRPDENNDALPENGGQQQEQEETQHTVPNPFDPNDQRKISDEELENEQKYKEALTERD